MSRKSVPFVSISVFFFFEDDVAVSTVVFRTAFGAQLLASTLDGSLVQGRTFDGHLLDMAEFGVEGFGSLASFTVRAGHAGREALSLCITSVLFFSLFLFLSCLLVTIGISVQTMGIDSCVLRIRMFGAVRSRSVFEGIISRPKSLL